MTIFKKKPFMLVLTILLSMTMVLAACGGGSEEAGGDSGDSGSDDTYTIRVAYSVPEDHASHIAGLAFKEDIEEKSDGRIQIELYPNGQLYASDREAVEAVQLNNIEMTVVATPTMATFTPEFSIFDLPFLFDSREAAYKAMDGDLGDALNEKVSEIGLVSLGYGENGFRHLLNSKRPIEKPEDMQGLKMRVMENKVYEDMFNTLGANSSPLAFGELYSALQQGVYDGMDNPISLVSSMKFYEVQEYMTLSSHTFAPIISVMNKDFYDSLPEDLQEILQESMTNVYNQTQRETTQQQDEEKLAELEQELEINELTAEQKEAFAEALQPIYDKYSGDIGEDLIDMARAANE
ncbi:DctP family TRAP transporter solute-binding subunit [Siminovitchia sediminis]|uniref:DctP family TRAP transporter solute-binding subunit n=1 Tax=Siminovitchia sediminis TaxID=1274353 RepID=A0ABW4KJ13_9BACI